MPVQDDLSIGIELDHEVDDFAFLVDVEHGRDEMLEITERLPFDVAIIEGVHAGEISYVMAYSRDTGRRLCSVGCKVTPPQSDASRAPVPVCRDHPKRNDSRRNHRVAPGSIPLVP